MATFANSSKDLLAAVDGDDLDRLKKILQSGVDPNINRGQDYSLIPLHVAALDGEVEKIKCLLQFEADVQIEDNIGCTALHWAANNGRADTLELLISHGADVNKQDTNGGWTALHTACFTGYVACVRILLEHGADVALRTSDGETASDLAVKEKKTDVVKLLDDFIWTRVNGLQSISDSMAANTAQVLHQANSDLEDLLPPPPPPHYTPLKDEPKWSVNGTKLLISEYAELKDKYVNKGKTKMELWRAIATVLKERDYDYSPELCNRKWRNLLIRYRVIKDNKNKTGRDGRKMWSFFSQIDDIMAKKECVITAKESVSKRAYKESTDDSNSLMDDTDCSRFDDDDDNEGTSQANKRTDALVKKNAPKAGKNKNRDEPPAWFLEYARERQTDTENWRDEIRQSLRRNEDLQRKKIALLRHH